MSLFERGPQGPAGPQGSKGKELLSGSGAPSADTGVDGDHYLDKTASMLYGPKASGAWGSGTSVGGSSVADDIAKSAGTTIDRVQGIHGRPIANDAPARGDVPGVWNEDAGEFRPGKPVPPGHFNCKDYGAVGDNVTDDTAAIQATFNAMDDGELAGVLQFPPGEFYCADDIRVTRPAIVRGVQGGSQNSLSKIRFAPGKQFIAYHLGAPVSAGGVTAQNGSFENLDIITAPVTTTAWAAATAYSVGDTRILTGANWAYLECIKAGTSGASLATSLVPYEPDLSREFQPSTQYRYGEIVRGTTDQLAVAADGSNLITSVVFQVTLPANLSAATSGATRPVWDTTIGNTTVSGGLTFTAVAATQSWVADGTAVWAAKVHAGILVKTRCTIDRVYVYRSTNAGICIRANSGTSNANHTELRHVWADQCGIGIMVSGSDANMVYAANCDVQSAGYGMPGNGGIGILDAGFLNSTWINCEVANDPTVGGGASFKRTLAGVPSVFINCYTEGYGVSTLVQSEFDTSAIVIGGNWGGGFTSGSTHIMFDSGNVQGCRYVTGKNNGGAAPIYSYLGLQDGINALGWGIGATVDGVNLSTDFNDWPNNWWTFGRANSATPHAFAIPAPGAAWFSGQALDAGTHPFWVTQERLHVGRSYTDPRSIGFGALPTAGYFTQGAITWNTNTSAGQPVGWVCTTAGVPGVHAPIGVRFDQSQMALTGYWATAFTASPWPGSNSTGDSDTHSASEATNPPTVGAAVNGINTTEFDGVDNELTLDGTLASYITASQFSGFVPVWIDSIDTNSAAPFTSNEAILSTVTAAYFGLYLRNGGGSPTVNFYTFDTGDKNCAAPIATGAWQMVQFRKANGKQQVRVNRGKWFTTESGNVGSLANALRMGTSAGALYFFDGRVAPHWGLTDQYLSDRDFADILAAFEARFAVTLA